MRMLLNPRQEKCFLHFNSSVVWVMSAFMHCRHFSDDDDDDGGDAVGKNPKLSASFSYQVRHAAAQPQPAFACPLVCSRILVLFVYDFREKIIPFLFLFFRHCKSKQVVPSTLHHTLSAQSSAFTSVFTLMGADLSAYLFQIFSHGKHGEYKGFVVAWGNHREGVYEPPYAHSCHLLRLMKPYSCL